MTPVSERVVQNARECLEILNDDFELDMNLYNNNKCVPVKEENVCKTTFCLAGWQAHKENYPEEYFMRDGFDYHSYSDDKLGENLSVYIWHFFYSGEWCNDKEYAKERMRFVIENKAIPKVINNFEFEGWPWNNTKVSQG